MKEIILKVLNDIACDNTGTCQINFQAESARQMIADKLEPELQQYINQILEDVCCGGGWNE